MAERKDELSDAMGSLCLESWKELGLDDHVQKKLKHLENNYESVFSWDIKQLTGINRNSIFNFKDRIQEKCKIIIDNDNTFNLDRFSLTMILAYENYINGKYEESLLEVQSIVKYMDSIIFDKSNEQYKHACNHVARASKAYVALTLQHDSDKLLKDVKLADDLNQTEKAVICAVKALVFLEYPPLGNSVALKFADEAQNLHPSENEYIIIWLKAKGRVRRFHDKFKMPEKGEIEAAELLSKMKTKPQFLYEASKLYLNIAFIHKINKNFKESDKYYKISLDLVLGAIELAKDNILQLYYCLITYIEQPLKNQSKTVMNQVIKKLEHMNSSRLDEALGKYFLKHFRDYEKAKMYFSRGMAGGNFKSSLQLVKVECLLQPVNSYPLVQALNMLYDVYESPKRRVIVLIQLLIYFCYCENNPKETMQYLKLFMDQKIDNAIKKKELIFAFPLFQINGFKPHQFLYHLSDCVKKVTLRSKSWSSDEKEIVDNTFDRFNKMLKDEINENQYFHDAQFSFHNQNYDNNLNKKFNDKIYNDGNNEDNWRKQNRCQNEYGLSFRINYNHQNLNWRNRESEDTSKNFKSNYHGLFGDAYSRKLVMLMVMVMLIFNQIVVCFLVRN